jgi:hypothetical protein
MKLLRSHQPMAFAIWVMLAPCAGTVAAQPVERDVLDHVEVERTAHALAVHIYFRFPINYVRHFPFESGDTLLIHVTPTFLEKREKNSAHREALRPPNDPDVPITDIVYDDRTLWDPYLMLHFSRQVDFRVRQGSDFRSIIVEFPIATPSPAPSLPSSEPQEQSTP